MQHATYCNPHVLSICLEHLTQCHPELVVAVIETLDIEFTRKRNKFVCAGEPRTTQHRVAHCIRSNPTVGGFCCEHKGMLRRSAVPL